MARIKYVHRLKGESRIMLTCGHIGTIVHGCRELPKVGQVWPCHVCGIIADTGEYLTGPARVRAMTVKRIEKAKKKGKLRGDGIPKVTPSFTGKKEEDAAE